MFVLSSVESAERQMGSATTVETEESEDQNDLWTKLKDFAG